MLHAFRGARALVAASSARDFSTTSAHDQREIPTSRKAELEGVGKKIGEMYGKSAIAQKNGDEVSATFLRQLGKREFDLVQDKYSTQELSHVAAAIKVAEEEKVKQSEEAQIPEPKQQKFAWFRR